MAATAARATPEATEHRPGEAWTVACMAHNSIDAENERTKPVPAGKREGTWPMGSL